MNQTNKSNPLSLIIIALVLVFLVSCMSTCGDSDYTPTTKTNECKSCGRSYPAGDDAGNFMNIAKTGMCKNCYNNYKSMSQFLG